MSVGTGLVPRFRETYTRHQSDSRSALIALGWVDDEINELLGEADAQKLEGGPAYGADRVLLASLSLDHLLQHPRQERNRQWRDRILAGDPDMDAPVVLPIKLEGFPWLCLCRAVDAHVDAPVVVRTRHEDRPRVIRRVAASWGEFALVAVGT